MAFETKPSNESEDDGTNTSPREDAVTSARLLVGVDVYGQDDDALRQAFAFATLLPNTQIDVAWAPPISQVPLETGLHAGQMSPPDPEQLLVERVARAMNEEERQALIASGAHVRLHIAEGSPTRALSELAFSLGSDMLIVGAHEKSKLETLLLGSTAKSLVQEAPCPVLVARPKAVDAVPEVEEGLRDTVPRGIGRPHRYHEVSRNVRARENMPLLFPMNP